MPTLSMFFGIIITMHRENVEKHKLPHLHATYQDDEVVLDFNGEVLSGSIPNRKLKLVVAWIEINRDDLEANWRLISQGREFFRIKPLI